MSKTKSHFLDIEHFEKKCHDDNLELAKDKKLWENLRDVQTNLGKSYKMKYKFLRGYNCPNCNTHLGEKFIFRDDEGCIHTIYSCSICGYRYARKTL